MQKTSEYFFRFADLVFSLKHRIPLSITANFSPFRTEKCESDCSVDYLPVDELPSVTGHVIYDGLEYKAVKCDDGRVVRLYKDALHGDTVYANCFCEPVKGKSVVYYIRGFEKYFCETNNSFFHSDWEKLILWQNRLILHAACVQTQFGGILFSGPSGIGKSTQAGLWETYEGARQINGDRPILYKDESGWLAAGSPYAGSSKVYVQESVPIRAIVVLQQCNSCSLRRLSVFQAFKKLYSCSTVYDWDREYVQRVTDLVDDLASAVPVYLLCCTPDQNAVELLKAELSRQNGEWVAETI